MRSGRSALARASAVALAAGATLLLTAAPAFAAPGITVDPAGDLAAKSTVSVTVTGFRPGTTVVVAECRPDESGKVAGPGSCADPSTGSSAVAVVDKQGGAKATLTITVGDIRSGVSCTGTDCVIAAVSTSSTATQASVAISLIGEGTSLPSPSSTPSATPSDSAAPTDSASPSESASPTETSAEPVVTETSTAPANGNAGGPAKLPQTGPEDATRTLLIGVVALQVGLIVALRVRRGRPARAAAPARRH